MIRKEYISGKQSAYPVWDIRVDSIGGNSKATENKPPVEIPPEPEEIPPMKDPSIPKQPPKEMPPRRDPDEVPPIKPPSRETPPLKTG